MSEIVTENLTELKKNRSYHNDLTFFTNEDGQKLEDRFKSTLKDVQYFDILVGYFRTSGFYRLYKDFENIEKIRILVGLNADKKAVEIIKSSQQQKIDFDSHSNTKTIYSENVTQEIYEADDTQETEIGIKKFIEYIRSGKLEIKAYPSNDIHAKVYISRFKEDDRDYGRVITGSSNFSDSGLRSQHEFNVELKNTSDVMFAQEKFENLWKDAVDLSETYIDTVNKKTWLNDEITPYEIYLKFLYENFEKRLNEDENIDIQYPHGFMELRYQKQAVLTLREIVEAYGGAFIADVVGLGKTYMTAMYAQGLPGKKLIICPPPIIESWKDAISDFGVRSATIESLGKLHQIKKKGYEKYDYVFVDEAHRFRNEDTAQYKLLNEICYGKKVILITATPLNNSVYDFFPLLKLFQHPKDSDIPGMKNLEGFFVNARSKLNQLDRSEPEYLEEVKRISKQVRNKILKYVMIRRTRTDVKEYFKDDIKNQKLFFPEVAEPNRIFYQFDATTNNIFNETIKRIKDLSYSRYQPGNYLIEQMKLDAFSETQEQNLVGFMKTMLVKRLESSKYAFCKTIERFITSYEKFIKMYEAGNVYISKKIDVYDYLDNENEDALIEALEKDEKAKIYSKEHFKKEFIENLTNDYNILVEIQNMWKLVNQDFKKEEFKKQIKEDKTLSANKIIIFSESMETGLDLYRGLVDDHQEKVLFFSSGICYYNGVQVPNPVAKDLIHQNYDPKNNEQDDTIQILITTDVLAEGINLHKSNIIVNYDLPWNPTRVLQRVGRVNRVGTTHKNIFIYNFFPTSETDIHLGLESSVKSKIQAFHETLGEDAKYLSDEEETTNHKLFGEKFYDKINDKSTYNEDDVSENTELKYIDVLRQIQENDLDLFKKIKRLPKKARTARTFKIKQKALLTFFKKGRFFKTYLSNGLQTLDLVFDDAVKYFECDRDCKKMPITDTYYHLLQSNKDAFVNVDIETEIETSTRGGASNHSYVKGRIEFALKEGKLTNEQEEYLNKILALYKVGAVVKDASKKIKDEIEKERDSLKVYQSIKNNISDTYLKSRKPKKQDEENISEIILSEFLIEE